MMKYFQIGALVGLVAVGFWFNSVLNKNKELRLEN